MSPSPDAALTIVYVHAHPDDEALFTGGRTALGAAAGARQVLITMTDGSLGFDPSGRTPDDPAHDRRATARARATELKAASELLGFSQLVQLGYPDSGMAGWATGADPRAFVNRPVDEVAGQLRALIEAEGRCVVVTYDATGFYGHPDHVATHHAVMAAVAGLESVERVEAVVMTESDVESALARAQARGEELPEWLGRRLVTMVADDLIDRTIDVEAVAQIKQAALGAHVTQIDNRALVELDLSLFRDVFGHERYTTLADRWPSGTAGSGAGGS